MKYGYARISSKGQKLDRQIKALELAGVDRIFCDRESGKDFNREAYCHLYKRLKKGDHLVIKSIDRLGRNYEEIIEQWRKLTEYKQVDIEVLDFPLLNTSNRIYGLTGKFLADLVLQILSYVAQVERENIHQRQMEGIKVAKEKGVRFGRPSLTPPENFSKLAYSYKNGEIPSLRVFAKMLGVSHTTVAKWISQIE